MICHVTVEGWGGLQCIANFGLWSFKSLESMHALLASSHSNLLDVNVSLVGGFNTSEEYESIGRMIPNIW